jgi:transposase
MTKRNTFSKEFKLEAVRKLERGDKSPNEIAMDLGVRRNQLYKWQTQLKEKGHSAFCGSGRKPLNQSDEVTRLRRELADVKLERDILKKAAAYFARELP